MNDKVKKVLLGIGCGVALIIFGRENALWLNVLIACGVIGAIGGLFVGGRK